MYRPDSAIALLCAGVMGTALLASAPASRAVTQAGDPPAVRRAREVIAVVSAGTMAAARTYAADNIAEDRREFLLGFLFGTQDLTRGLEFESVLQATASEALVRVRTRLTGDWQSLQVRVQPDAPFRIVGLTIGPDPGPPSATKTPITIQQVVRELDGVVTKLTDADLFSGAVLLAKDGEVVYSRASGEANKDYKVPNRLDTRFSLGSMNKMFTAVAIAQLAERGKLSLDDPLSTFLPEFPDKESAGKIKIKHLLSHTAGLGSYFNRRFMESSRERYRTVDDFMELVKGERLLFEPGTKWQYSNTGFLTLGAVIEKVSGQNYFDYVREHIYAPAGMTNSDSYDLERVNANIAVGYEKDFTDAGIRFKNNLFQTVVRGGPAGGGYSTVEDLLKFSVALRANKLVGAAYVQQLLSAKPELSSPDYGFGFVIDRTNQIAGHSGGFPGISSNMDMFLRSGYTAIVLSNYGFGSVPVRSRLRDMIVSLK